MVTKYKMITKKIMKNRFHGDYFKSYLPAKPGVLFSLEGVYMN